MAGLKQEGLKQGARRVEARLVLPREGQGLARLLAPSSFLRLVGLGLLGVTAREGML